MTTVYLAGPINGCSDSEMNDWRDDMTRRLDGLAILSPTVRDYRGKEADNVEEIVEGDKADIRAADIIVAYCPQPSVGTSMEVLYAWERGKFVIVYAPPGSAVSPWLRYHSFTVTRSADAAADVVWGLS